MQQFTTLFDSFIPVFTAPSFLHFQTLMVSLWCLPLLTGGRMSLVRVWAVSGVSQHWDALLRFVRSYVWEQDELARCLTLCVLERVKARLPRTEDGRRLLLIGVDETGDEHPSAKKMFGVSRHHHHSARVGQSKYRKGHCWVTLSILTDVSEEYVRSFAIHIALYIARKSCPPATYQSKRELATEMLNKLEQWVGWQYQIVVVGDGYYACRAWIAEQREKQRRVVTRLRSDARLYELPPSKRRKGRGRPKTYGKKICLWRRALTDQKFEAEQEILVYGRKHAVRLRKMVCVWRGLEEPVSVVIVKGIGKKPVYLLDTDGEASAVETLHFYGARHAVEQPYEDLKCDGGLGHYLGRTEQGVRRFAQLCVTSHTLLRLIEIVPEMRGALAEVKEPWRKRLEHLTMGQLRTAISKLMLEEHERSGNFFNFDVQARDANNAEAERARRRKAA
ncbi:MAG: transposase [Acidobacteria bacterium]|nr:transposase [Acidobacteriota bacterium]